MVQKNLDELVVDKHFPHAIVDKAYLNQWLTEHQWK